MIDPLAAAAFEALLGRRAGHLLLVVDDDLHIVRAGPEAALLAERSAKELTGMSLIAAFGSATLDALARRALVEGTTGGEAGLGRLSGRRFAIDAVRLPGGGLVLSLHEVTELRRAERMRRDFVANIGHELRTPLTSIKLLSETLASGMPDDPIMTHELASRIERETDHLARLVDELLDLSMIESGATKLAITAVDPDEIVAEAAGRIGPVADGREITVRRLPPPRGGVRAQADAARLGQALLNLAHNAVKYSQPGAEVRIGWEEAGARVRFSVADDGVGVPELDQGRLFERFYRVDRARARSADGDEERRSAGLGLSIVRHIAEAHGGSVGLVSEEGVGSTFWIEVPQAS